MPAGAAAIPVQNYHVTLVFIGEAEAAEVKAAIGGLRFEPIALYTLGYGHFSQKLFYLGIRPVAELLGLQKSLVSALCQARVPVDTRSFVPHITLARASQPWRQDETETCINRPVTAHSWRAEGYSLFCSELRPSGVCYTEIVKFPALS